MTLRYGCFLTIREREIRRFDVSLIIVGVGTPARSLTFRKLHLNGELNCQSTYALRRIDW